MAYSKQNDPWVNGTAGGTEIDAAALNGMETGIASAHTTADAAVPKSTVTTAGDLIYGTGAAAVTRLAIGAAGTVLKGGASAPSWASIVNADVDAAAAIAYSKLNVAAGDIAVTKLAAGSDGQVLTTSGTTPTWAAAPGNTVYRKVTEKDVVSTNAETDLLNGEVTIGAGVMSTNKTARAVLSGDILDNTAGADTFTLKVKLGATTMFDDALAAFGQSATRRTWRLVFEITNLTASSQWLDGTLFLGNAAAGTSGLGNLAVTDVIVATFSGSAAINTAVAAALAVTVTPSASDANLSWRLKRGLVEVV